MSTDKNLIKIQDISASFEFFPPKNDKMQAQLWSCIQRLQPLAPRFVSVTYGAGGSTRQRTHETLSKITTETGLKAAAHLTCIGASEAEINEIAQKYWMDNIRHIVALRGDLPLNETYAPGAYKYAVDLVKALKKIADFEISVAAYPETHPEAVNKQTDLDNLKRKIDAGASRAITQYFFDVNHYIDFIERCDKANITVPIIPGILPVTNFEQVKKFSKLCGATIPVWMNEIFEGLDEDVDTRLLVAASLAAEQCRELARNGVREFHFYTLNRADLTYAICRILGLRPNEFTKGSSDGSNLHSSPNLL